MFCFFVSLSLCASRVCLRACRTPSRRSFSLSLSNAIDATDDCIRPPPRHRRGGFSSIPLDRRSRLRDGQTLKAWKDAEKRTGGKGGGDRGTAPRRAALDSDEAEMGSRAGDADGDRRVLGDAACGDRGGGRASGSATAWAMRKEMSRLSSGVFFGFGCFTGSGVLRPMAASRAAARHRQPRAALAPTSQRCRVGRVREALVCLIFESRLGTGFFGNAFQIGVSLANSFLQTGAHKW